MVSKAKKPGLRVIIYLSVAEYDAAGAAIELLTLPGRMEHPRST